MVTRPTVTESTWRGVPRYGCSACAFDTLDRSRAEEHVAHGHEIPPAKPDPPPVIVAAPNGLAPMPEPTASSKTKKG